MARELATHPFKRANTTNIIANASRYSCSASAARVLSKGAVAEIAARSAGRGMPMRSDHTQGQLAQVVAGLSEGVILIEADHTLSYANEAALAMHGVGELGDLGATVSEYRANFVLHYRNHREVGPLQHPIERVLAGEAFRDAVVEVHHARDPTKTWMHRIRGLVLNDAEGRASGRSAVPVLALARSASASAAAELAGCLR